MAPHEAERQGAGIDAALAHISAGRLPEAEAICRALVEANKHDGHAWHLLGAIALQRRDVDTAIASCRQAIAVMPDFAKAHSNLGAALVLKGRLAEAIGTLETATRIDPDFAPAYVNLGDALLKENRIDDAVSALERAVALAPDHVMAHVNLGGALTRQRKLDRAIAVLKTAVRLDPSQVAAHNNLGNALRFAGDFEGALAALHRARALAPRMAEIPAHLGLAYRVMGRLDEAADWLGKALALRPDYLDAAYFRSGVLLAQGRFAEGWRDYLARFSIRATASALHRQPLGGDLAGKHIVLVRDQGLGDEIFFLRFAPELKRRGAQLTYCADGKIASLLRRLPFLDTVIERNETLPPSDLIVSVGDLPFLLGMGAVDQCPPTLRLPPRPDRLEAQRAALAAIGPPPYIGLTWRAGSDAMGTLFKAAPLDRLGAALRPIGATLVALQRLPEPGEIERLSMAAGRPVHDFTALNDRLEDMLALLALLDDYVTVSNTNVHLRAAAGRRCRVLVPSPPEFRWMATGSTSPWFPDSIVYRQDIGGSWDAALARLDADLAGAFRGP
jgi:tetratricopeptide (TPR) repeat protein